MAVERRERRLKGNLIPPESGSVLNTRPVEAAGCRSRATPAWPLGVTSTSRVDRRDDGSPPERRSRQGGACAAKTVMTTRCPPSAGLPRSWPGSGWHPSRAQAFSWLHDAAWMGGWGWYRAADRCGGCGCDLADVLVVSSWVVTGPSRVMLAGDGRDVDGWLPDAPPAKVEG
jgi:hypothetical protein